MLKISCDDEIAKDVQEKNHANGRLVLSRRIGERVIVSGRVVVEVVAAQGGVARLRFEAPLSTSIWREEVYQRLLKNKIKSNARKNE